MENEKYIGLEYPIPRRISNKFFFNISMFDMILVVVVFIICNSIISPVVKNFMSVLSRLIFVNYGPTFVMFGLLQEDKKTGESLMSILIDFIIFTMKPKKYIYKGTVYHKRGRK